MIMFATGGVMFAYNKIQIPADKPQEFTSFMCPATVAVTTPCTADNAIARLHGDTDRQFVKLADMPDTLKQAVIAAEDRGFFKHGGVSATGVMRALVQDIRGGATQGGSTITQQYVKNAYLTQERTITRKAKEAVLAVKLEQKLSKEEILERYLNTIYFGRGAYGVGAASRAYFAIPINQLSLAQAAYLAAVIRSPRGADPETKPEKATERRHSVLAAMLQEGYVTEPQRAEADAVPWVPGFTFVPYSTANNVEIQGSDFGSQYFVEYVRSQLEEKYNFSDEEIYGGGLQIYTTFDPGMQQKAYEAVQQNLGLPEDPWASLVAVDAEGQIKAMYGGADFKTNQVNTALGKDGGGTGQQPGSTMKPFVLAAALKAGISLDSRFPSPDEITIEEANDGADWPVRNSHAEKSVDEKNLDLREGIAQSSNTVFAQLELAMGAKKIGVDKRHADQAVSGAQQIAEAATAMGVTTGLPPEASLVLGTTEVSPLEMASAYSTLARGGTAIEPFAITKVVRPNKEEIILGGTPRPGAIPPEHAAQIVDTMQGVVREGTGKAANFGVPAAGKTGTTNNFVDAWFIGFVPTRLTAAVWMGHDGSQPMLNVHGVKEVVGGTLPAKIWKSFMQAVVEGTDVGTFPPVTEFPGEKLNGELRLPSDPPVTTVKEQPTTTTSPPTTTTTRPKPTLPTFTLPTRPPAEETTTTPRTFPTFPGGGGGGNGGPFGPFPDEEQDLVR
jgi:penicillin-binding protein 1A